MWFVLVGLVILVREACAVFALGFVWADGWLHITHVPSPAVVQLLALLSLPIGIGFIYVGLRLHKELAVLLISMTAGRMLLQLALERSLGYELSLLPFVAVCFLAWHLRRTLLTPT